MLSRRLAVALMITVCGLSSASGVAQANPSEPDTLQNILRELKSIHEDLRINGSSQVLLIEWQMQQAQVNQATERRDKVRSELTQAQNDEAQAKLDAAHIDEALSRGTVQPELKRAFLDKQEYDKAQLGLLKGKEETLSSDLANAESKLREDQNKLDEIQGQLDAIMQHLRTTPHS